MPVIPMTKVLKKINNGMFISLSRSIEKDNTYAN